MVGNGKKKVEEDGEMRSDYELGVRMKSSFIYKVFHTILCFQSVLRSMFLTVLSLGSCMSRPSSAMAGNLWRL